MKKAMLSLAVVALVAAMASCSKTCTCKSYMNGQLVETNPEVELGDYKNCSDMNSGINLGDMFNDPEAPEDFQNFGMSVECEEN
ncbi:MAG: hypothetical protein IKJ67_04860 [Bacteroidales bacterium]|nr:hypothetical protein [Bacteroidales bacterium]